MKKYILLVLFSCHLITAGLAQSWSLTGNSGTNPSTNFLGTKDNQPLVFKTNNNGRMYILSNGKTGIGIKTPVQLLDVNGNINISAGSSLYIDNHRILTTDLTNLNLFLGTGTGTTNIAGVGNTSAGNNALYSISTGNNNTAVGMAALFSNSASRDNTAVGHTALYSNTTGYENTATGMDALYNNTTGVGNTATGMNALYHNISGNNNTALGYFALNVTMASYNNVAAGVGAGGRFDNGPNNTFLGTEARAAADGLTNSIALGYATYVAGSNSVRIGNNYITSIGGVVGWSNLSDGRVKRNIKQNVPGLSFINKLKPVTYNLNLDAADKILQLPVAKDKDEKLSTLLQEESTARNAKQQLLYTGFVAQEVEQAAKEIGYDFSGVDAAKSDKDLYGLRYAEFVVPLVKAVQELSKMNDEKDAKMEAQQKQIDELKQAVKALINNGTKISSSSALPNASAYLQQNSPNPFSQNTIIRCSVPSGIKSAQIVVYNNDGKQLKTYMLSSSGMNTVTIDAGTLAAGTYKYTLLIDGKVTDSKSMLIVR